MKKLFYCLRLLCFIILPATIMKAQNLLDPLSHPKFINPLPVPSVLDARSGGSFNIGISQFQQDLGLINPKNKKPMLTTVWGYNGSYPGPTILAKKDVPIDVTWNNQLVKTVSLYPTYFLSTFQ